MKQLIILVLSALIFFNLPARADDTAGMHGMHNGDTMADMSGMQNSKTMPDMSGMKHSDNMAAMPGMQHGGAMMAAGDTAAPSDYHSRGIIKRWENQHISIAHHAIAALHWPAMTMTFAVPAGLDGRKLAEGTPVDFSFRQDEQGYRLTAIHPVKP